MAGAARVWRSGTPLFRTSVDRLAQRVFNRGLLRTSSQSRWSPKNLDSTKLQPWKSVISRHVALGGLSEGNQIQYFNSGNEQILQQWHAIDNAKESIDQEIYTLSPDKIGHETIARLTRAQKRGVQVRILIDQVGSYTLPKSDLKPLINAGGDVVWYNRITPWQLASFLPKFDFSLFKAKIFRNHRKTLVVDNKRAFVGSSNYGVDYAGKAIGGNGRFRDSGCVVEGPAVTDVRSNMEQSRREAQSYFRAHEDIYADDFSLHEPPRYLLSPRPLYRARNFVSQKLKNATQRGRDLTLMKYLSMPVQPLREELTIADECVASDDSSSTLSPDNVIEFSDLLTPDDDASEGALLQILTQQRRRGQRKITLALESAMNNASESIFITNPYFAPSKRIRQALARAADRGVDVRVLTTGESDIPVSKWGAQPVLYSLVKNGIHVYEYERGVLHAKTVVIDGVYSSLGTYNFDDWSDFRNLETNVSAYGREYAAKLTEHFDQDLSGSRELTLKDFENRSVWQRSLHTAALYVNKMPNFLESDRWREHLSTEC